MIQFVDQFLRGALVIIVFAVSASAVVAAEPTVNDLLMQAGRSHWKPFCTERGSLIEQRATALRQQPSHADYRTMAYLRGSCLIENHRENDAAMLLKEAVTNHPKDGLLWETLGTAYMRLGQDREAIDVLEKAATQRRSGGIHSKLGLLHMRLAGPLSASADKATRRQLLQRAEIEVRRAMEIDNLPHSPLHYPMLAHILTAQGRFDEAIKLFEQAIALIPGVNLWNDRLKQSMVAECKAGIGQAYASSGNRKQAEVFLEEAVRIAPTAELRRSMEMIRDTTLAPAKTVQELESRYPRLPFAVPLDED